MIRLTLVLALAFGFGCGDDERMLPDPDSGTSRSDSGTPRTDGAIMLMDSGGGGGSTPGQLNGLGSASADCVAYCRSLFDEGCGSFSTCFGSDGSCSRQDISASQCAANCANAATYQAALSASGCTSQYQAYENCVASVSGCNVFDSDCGIDWGVYASCAGL